MRHWTKKVPTTAGWYWCRYKIKNHDEYRIRPAQVIVKNKNISVYLSEMPTYKLEKEVKFGARIADYPPINDRSLTNLINKIKKLYLTDLQRGRDGSWHWAGKNGLTMLALIAKYLKSREFKVNADKCGHSVPMQYTITLGAQEYYMAMKFDPQPYGWDKLTQEEQTKRITPVLEFISKFPIKTAFSLYGKAYVDNTFLDQMRASEQFTR